MRPISKEKELNVGALLQKNFSSRKVAQAVGLSQSTVNRIRKKCFENIDMSKGGRPKALNSYEKRFVVRSMTVGRLENAVQATRALKTETGVDVCVETVRNALREAGLGATEKVSKPALTAKNVKDRLAFAETHKYWTVSDWERVVFSDETRVNRFNSDGRTWCWIRDKKNLPNHTVKQTVKHGGGSVMVWSCLTSRGVGNVYKIDGRMNATNYLELLEEELYTTLVDFNFDLNEVIFQQDNAPVHMAKIVQEWFWEQPYDVMKWPAQSPDLNPIEHVWASMKRRLNYYPTAPRNLHELWTRIEEVYASISVDECRKLYASMPSRIAAVLKSKGSWTNF